MDSQADSQLGGAPSRQSMEDSPSHQAPFQCHFEAELEEEFKTASDHFRELMNKIKGGTLQQSQHGPEIKNLNLDLGDVSSTRKTDEAADRSSQERVQAIAAKMALKEVGVPEVKEAASRSSHNFPEARLVVDVTHAPEDVSDDEDISLPELPETRGRSKVFVLWDRGGRTVTPVSSWKSKKRDLTRASEAAAGVFAESATLRSSLVGPTWPPPSLSTIRPCSQASSTSEPPENSGFEGLWMGRSDGEIRGRIEGSRLTWEVDGSVSPLRIIRHQSRGGCGDVVSFVLDGESHFGTLSADGSVLRWRDGDRWVRVDESLGRMQAYCSRALSPTGRRRRKQNIDCVEDLGRSGCWSRSAPMSRPSTTSRTGSRPSSQQFSSFLSAAEQLRPLSMMS